MRSSRMKRRIEVEESILPSASEQLFRYARGHVTCDDIGEFAPSDPGYANYVRAFTKIHESGTLPHEVSFDLSETIGLTRWWPAGEYSGPPRARFRRFRTFVTSVGLDLCVGRKGLDQVFPPNYTAITLIDDAVAIADP